MDRWEKIGIYLSNKIAEVDDGGSFVIDGNPWRFL
jgi:hypothetical protein